MGNENKQPSKFQRDWQSHYPVIIIYLCLVITCVVVGKVTEWKTFGFLLYALLAIGIMYLLTFLPWYFTSLKAESISPGLKTTTRGVSLILGIACAFLMMFETWGNWTLSGNPTPIVPLKETTSNENDFENRIVYVSKAGKYHEATCRYARQDMQRMSVSEAEGTGKIPGKCCHH